MTAMYDAARDLARAGWAIFPCEGKRPRTTHGHLEATTDDSAVRAWWRLFPDANIAAPVPPSMLVIENDPRNGGHFEALEAVVGPLPQTLTVWSGREDGGHHLYFLRPSGAFTSTKLPPGIDLKVNGYCMLPPSIHPATGKPYRWELHDVAPLPARLRELLRPTSPPRETTSRNADVKSDALIRFVATLAPGNRNSGLHWAACRAAQTDLLQSLSGELLAAALAVGLSEHEARRTIESAARKYAVHA